MRCKLTNARLTHTSNLTFYLISRVLRECLIINVFVGLIFDRKHTEKILRADVVVMELDIFVNGVNSLFTLDVE